ncbi:MAG: response regulator [Deltaproteobacteria bacterium]|nr:response regulator [Myxococcales bacterium]MDP3215463.1 response regulator [Deltaproteobacteria bacterium]
MSNEGAVIKPGTRVLLVDHNPADIEAVHRCLVDAGCVTTVIHDGSQGVVAARRDPPALAVLDVAVPEVNGYQLCRELKRLDPPPVVVLLSPRSTPEDLFWATQCGADLFLARPVDPEVFLQGVAALLGGP